MVPPTQLNYMVSSQGSGSDASRETCEGYRERLAMAFPREEPRCGFLVELLTRRATCLDSGICDLKVQSGFGQKPINSSELKLAQAFIE